MSGYVQFVFLRSKEKVHSYFYASQLSVIPRAILHLVIGICHISIYI